MRDRQIVEISKPGRGDMDVVTWVVFTKNEYVAERLADAAVAVPRQPAAHGARLRHRGHRARLPEVGGKSGGVKGYLDGPGASLFGIPFSPETSIMLYRTDIFEEYDLEVPTTYDELLETAAFITENVPDVYGMTTRGSAGHQVVHAWLLHLSPFGGTVLNDDFTPAVNSPEAIAATYALQTILENSPPGMAAAGAGEQDAAFLQGDSAMYLDRSVLAAQAADPARSRVVGNVGYALHPEQAQCGSETGGFVMGIPSNSQNQEAAWLFIQWFTNKRMDLELAKAGANPIRTSTHADPELQATFPWYATVVDQLAVRQRRLAPADPRVGRDERPDPGRGDLRRAHGPEDHRGRARQRRLSASTSFSTAPATTAGDLNGGRRAAIRPRRPPHPSLPSGAPDAAPPTPTPQRRPRWRRRPEGSYRCAPTGSSPICSCSQRWPSSRWGSWCRSTTPSCSASTTGTSASPGARPASSASPTSSACSPTRPSGTRCAPPSCSASGWSRSRCSSASGLALLLEKAVRGATFFRTIFVMPLMIAPVVVGLIWRYLLDARNGIVNHYLTQIGEAIPFLQGFGFETQAWLGDPTLAMVSIIVSDVWQWTPFVFMIVLAGLQGCRAT